MNKKAKGAIAAGAATLLLLGGAGTFALWQDSTSVAAGNIQTGKLDLTASAGGWFTDPAGTNPLSAYAAIKPGDTVYYVANNVTVNGAGAGMYFGFDSTLGTVTASPYDISAYVGPSAYLNLTPYSTAITAYSNVTDLSTGHANQFQGPNGLIDGYTRVFLIPSDGAAYGTFKLVAKLELKQETPYQVLQDLALQFGDITLTVQQLVPYL